MIGPKVAEQTAREMRDAYELVTRRDNDMCQRCRRECGGIQRDHRQGRLPGNTVASNLQCLGAGCHAWKTANPFEAVEEGWAVLKHTTLTPAEWPARRWVKKAVHNTLTLSWVLYDNEGGFLVIDQDEADYRLRKGGA
jgi:hypothetical protein